MFNIGMVELLVLLAVAVVVVGPRDLPKVARWLAGVLRKLRDMITEFSSALNFEEDIKVIKEAGNELRESVREINPVHELTDEIQKVREATQTEIKALTDLPGALQGDLKGLTNIPGALKNELLSSSGGQDVLPDSGKKESIGG